MIDSFFYIWGGGAGGGEAQDEEEQQMCGVKTYFICRKRRWVKFTNIFRTKMCVSSN